MAAPVRRRYLVMAVGWSGLPRRVLEIRTAKLPDLNGRTARRIARGLGGRYLKEARP